MIFKPIIPIWVMVIISVIFFVMKRKGLFNYIRQILIVLLLFAVNLRPMIPAATPQSGVSMNVDVLFVIDDTMSMLAEDYEGNGRRVDAVKADCKYIMEKLGGASFSVVTFDNKVNISTPYTVDMNVTEQSVDLLNGQTKYYAEGSSMNKILEELESILDNQRDTYQVVFFISDGEITKKKESLESFPQLGQYVDAGAVLGYGTEEGGPMKVKDSSYDDDATAEYLEFYNDDYDLELAISCIDEDNLKSIASDLQVGYIHMPDKSELDKVISDIEKHMQSSSDVDVKEALSGNREFYYYIMIPLTLLLIYDFIYYRRRVFRKEKRD